MDTANTSPTAAPKKRKEQGGGDHEVWATFDDSFQRVQTVLDRNRVLIQQVNQNHQSRLPENMVKNVSLIQEINGNISQVASLYSDLSSNFTAVFHERNNLHADNAESELDAMTRILAEHHQ